MRFVHPALTFALALASLGARAQEDTALLHCATNLARGRGNFYLYQVISRRTYTIQPGDVLRYEIYLAPGCPQNKGGVDIQLRGGASLRDSGALDRAGRRAHGDADLSPAAGHWLAREIPLGALAGKVAERWDLQCEGDAPGLYVQLLDNIEVRRGDEVALVIYQDGPPELDEIAFRAGYSKHTLLAAVPRRESYSAAELDERIRRVREKAELERMAEDYRRELLFLGESARRAGRADVLAALKKARAVAGPEAYEGRSAAEFEAELHRGRRLLAQDHAHPLARAYCGHLVGHAHIDFQWLWEWPETIAECKRTFGQAVRFMDEYPEFTFSQSSAALYLATERHHPELFERIRHYVAKGRWEIVGGRWCEGDTNMISGESHARHFLQGQRYFRERFGRIATVGWEPDTFGHTWTMPQMLRLAGIESYYFCRAGKGIPLFHWEGPDGSRVLAFEESATKSWYNSPVAWSLMDEMLDFELHSGSKDMLWVYGVGNHGGGPTREDILRALAWQENPLLPRVHFSTATEFFRLLRARDLTRIPVVRTELNSVFEGCYTTHGDMKRWNRRAENLLVALESVAALAARSGFEYPGGLLEAKWRDVLWNHHHDTLPGTSIHASYNLSRSKYEALFREAGGALEAALAHLARGVRGAGAGAHLVVNSLGWTRGGWIELPIEGPGPWSAISARGEPLPAQVLERAGGRRLLVRAQGIPGFGGDVVRVLRGAPPEGVDRPRGEARISAGGFALENERWRIELDRATGWVRSLVDRSCGRELVPAGEGLARLEVHLEQPNGMSAWEIGKVAKVEPLAQLESLEVVDRGPQQVAVRLQRRWRSSRITQRIALRSGSDCIDFSLEVDWGEKGGADRECPMLRYAFPLDVGGKDARFEIPFGEIRRPRDGQEVAALRWAALEDDQLIAGLLNDCRHGYRADAKGLSLSLVRSSYYPDPEPDLGHHVIGVALLLAHRGGQGRDLVLQRAARAFGQPLLSAPIPVGSFEDGLPRACPGVLAIEGAVLPTALKRAEDGDALVLRLYEPLGREASISLRPSFDLGRAEVVNFLEDELGPARIEEGAVVAKLRPYEILTLRLEPGR